MRPGFQIKRALGPVKTWLTGLLVVLMLALTVASGLHHQHQNRAADQHHCVVCLMAHGSLLADGAIGATIISASHSFDILISGETKPASICDLRLAPGRAPPV